jgi:uncharacterized lipoprotein YmbA
MMDPDVTPAFNVGAFALRRQQRFFLKVNPPAHKTRDKEEGCAVTPVSVSRRAASSGIVMSAHAFTSDTKNSTWAANLPLP